MMPQRNMIEPRLCKSFLPCQLIAIKLLEIT